MATSPAADSARRRPARAASVREATFSDYGQIAALHARNGLAARSKEQWVRLWRDNPAWREFGRPPICWVLESADGRVAGSISSLPFSCAFQGRRLLVSASFSWAVDAGYRRYSMLLLDRFQRQCGADLLISTTVSAKAEPTYQMFQWQRVPAGAWNAAALWVSHHRGFARWLVADRGLPLAGLTSLPLAVALGCRDRLRARASAGADGEWEISFCDQFDTRFDAFWHDLLEANANVLLADRSRQTLEWHFGAGLRRGDVRVAAVTSDARIVAWAIFDRTDVRGLRRYRLVDFRCLHGAGDTLNAVILRMLHLCREERVPVLEVTGDWIGLAKLRGVATPYRRILPSWLYYYRTTDTALGSTLRDPGVWTPSSWDGDASLSV